MNTYCGIDVIEVDRIKDAINSNSKFINKVFSKNEIEYIESIKSENKYQNYAGRYAAKEAIFKALSKILNDNNDKLDFLKIEIINDKDCYNRPKVNILDKNINDLIVLKNIKIDVSISHIEKMAVAMSTVQIKED